MKIFQNPLKDKYYDKVVDLYVNEHLSMRAISEILPVSHPTISRWISIFTHENPEVPILMRKTGNIKKEILESDSRQDLPDDVKALQDELTRVKEELRKEKLRADAYDTMIDIAEDMFKVPIRKKAGAKR